MKKLLPLIISLFLAVPVLAQQELSTTAIPPRLELEALPGATLQEQLMLRNESDTDQIFDIRVKDFIVSDNQGTPLPVEETVSGRWSLAAWMTASPKQLLVPAGQTVAADLIITVPADALPGGHYAMVTYPPVTENTIEGSGAAVSPQVGSLVYLKVIGDITEAVNLREFKVDEKFKHYGPTRIMAEIENLGDIHLRPAGKLTVANWLGDEVYSTDLEEKNIFPFASRIYEWEIPGKWRLGRYTAKLTASAGEAAIPVNGLIYFWIVPVKEAGLIAAALILILILALIKKRRPKTPADALVAPEPPLS